MGPHEQSIAKQAIRAGQPIPDRILGSPELDLGNEFYLQAFFFLDTERAHGENLAKIPWHTIVFYAEHHDCDMEMTQDLIYLIRELDTAHLDKMEAKRKANRGKKPTGSRK